MPSHVIFYILISLVIDFQCEKEDILLTFLC